ncbi:MAG: ribosome maturation factor [Chitinophagaceae bacterium]|jgi:ribosome maturation factor RimP|nr:ribosome maturation factor [Chitinophagaceae bacterium]
MNKEQQLHAIEEMVNRLLAEDPAYFLVGVQVKPTNNVKVFLDADTGVVIDRCVSYNRLLYKELEASGLFPSGDFSLEVSSPGLDEPLKMNRQYRKNIGRKVEVALLEGSPVQGTLKLVTEEGITVSVEKGKGRKKETEDMEIPFDRIKATKIMIVF